MEVQCDFTCEIMTLVLSFTVTPGGINSCKKYEYMHDVCVKHCLKSTSSLNNFVYVLPLRLPVKRFSSRFCAGKGSGFDEFITLKLSMITE